MTSYYDEQTFLTCRDFPLLARRVDSIRNWLSQGVRAPIHSHPNTPVVGPTRARATLSSHATYRLPHNPQLTFPSIQRNSCPTCRQQLLTLPGGGQLRELLEIRQEMSEHVRQLGGLLPLTDEQSEALGAAVLLLAQGDTESQLDFDISNPYAANRVGERHTTTYGGMYA